MLLLCVYGGASRAVSRAASTDGGGRAGTACLCRRKARFKNVKRLTSIAVQQETIRSRRHLRSTDTADEEHGGGDGDGDGDADDDGDNEHNDDEEEEKREGNDRQHGAPSSDVDMADRSEEGDSTPPASTALCQMDSPEQPTDVADDIKARTLPVKQVVMSCLESNFESGPPYTIQRLAELILAPTEHYSEPDKYLRAIQRLVTVTSTPSDYPSLSTSNGVDAANEYSIPIGLTAIASSASSSDSEADTSPDMTIHAVDDEDMANNNNNGSNGSNDDAS
ncbi:hypothetical protein SYNPS1DRAFT_28608 [Syncephalis pseudoplumigaleata]|uniref:PPP4R2-domain-containing protein n=1 Tax=Syncephalis pseudoplumigaleata TaxID=1712513 RepID=A0A4P9YZU6_9FUNG|nr:hypothetical protein SYNPS1DRAFT_28608 [Syncephalis pseudoplumigaleata]|eukprot:RKP25666.1 hypothetical protein SYNPS1DRAFT_28608 [Syncephalis pseudoplumigaleata]